jgi:outer membrane protein
VGFCLAGALSGAWGQTGDGAKIGVFDPGRVFELSSLGKQLRTEIETLTTQKREAVKKKENELHVMREQFRQEEPSLSEDRLSEREREMQQKNIELKRVRDDANREVQAHVADIEQKFQKEVLEVIERLGREGGYAVILDRAAVAFVSPAVDITDLIVSRLNAADQSASK